MRQAYWQQLPFPVFPDRISVSSNPGRRANPLAIALMGAALRSIHEVEPKFVLFLFVLDVKTITIAFSPRDQATFRQNYIRFPSRHQGQLFLRLR